jgi:HAD superfamily hydrolase (TIGR01509 family)
MDGLLVDSEPLWSIAERELFDRWGLTFTAAHKAAIAGQRMDTAVAAMIGFGAPGSRDETVESVSCWLLERMRGLYATELPVLPGVLDLLGEAAQAGVPQALVSSSYRVLVDVVLAAVPGHPFAVSVAGDEVTHGKPHPEPYLTGARLLGVDPRACVALEDSASGARAGAAAGCRIVYCPSVAGSLEPEPGWLATRSLADLRLDDLRARTLTGPPRPAGRRALPGGPRPNR